MRGFGVAFLLGIFVGLSGCGADNESEAEKAQKNLGAVPTSTAKPGEATPPPPSYDQRKPPDLNPEYSKQARGGGGRR
jgi:hypothetical protein